MRIPTLSAAPSQRSPGRERSIRNIVEGRELYQAIFICLDALTAPDASNVCAIPESDSLSSFAAVGSAIRPLPNVHAAIYICML